MGDLAKYIAEGMSRTIFERGLATLNAMGLLTLAAGLTTVWRTQSPRTLDGVVPLPPGAPRDATPAPWLISVDEVSLERIESAFP